MHAVPGGHRESRQIDDRAALGRAAAAGTDAGDERRLDLRPGTSGDEPCQTGAEAFPRGSHGMIFRCYFVIPAKAGTHLSASGTVERWVPACTGMRYFLG